MDISTLTIGQAREIAAMFNSLAKAIEPHPFVGKYVICRCYSAGVHAGVLVSLDDGNAILRDSRRLWRWVARSGVALSGVAIHGLKDGKIDTLVPEIALIGVIEAIPCSDLARDSISVAQ